MLRELIVPFLIGTIAVVLMFQANTYIYLAKTFNLDNVPKKAVLQFIYFQTPSYLNLTFAVGTALGSSLAMSRIARESELTAMRATGARILRVIAPVIAFGVAVAGLNFYVAEKVMPGMTRKANEVGAKIGVIGTTFDLKSNAVISLQGFTASFARVQRQGADAMTFEEVWLFEHPRPEEEIVYYAKSGHYEKGLWTFDNPRVMRLKGLDVVEPSKGTKLVINQRIFTEGMFGAAPPEEKSLTDLRQNIEDARRMHSPEQKRWEVQYYDRFSVPAACIVFALVGPVFAIMFARSGGFMGVLISIVMVLLYYNAYVISSEILSKIDFIPSIVAGWLPDALFTLLGIIAIRRLE